MKIEMEVVEGSSMIASRGHDYIENVLYVKFKNGSLYSYQGVTRQLFEEWKGAPSAGKYFNENILDQYLTERIS